MRNINEVVLNEITNGKLPSVDLYAVELVPIKISNSYDSQFTSIKKFEKDVFLISLLGGINQYNVIVNNKTTDTTEWDEAFINLLFTNYANEYFPTLIHETSEIQTIAITDIEKSIVGIVYAYYIDFWIHNFTLNAKFEEYIKELHDFVRLYWLLLEKETKYKKTISFIHTINTINSNTYEDDIEDVLNLILSDWEENISCLQELNDKESKQIEELIKSRNRYFVLMRDFYNMQFDYASSQANSSSWDMFISLVNYRRKNEKEVIELIKSDNLKYSKTKGIKEYLSSFSDSNIIDGLKIDTRHIAGLTHNRTIFAPEYCYLSTGNNLVIPIDDVLIEIAQTGFTFNYLLATYHLFRLEPTITNAKTFVASAYKYTMRNLSEDRINHYDSLFDYIKALYECITCFYKSHQSTIDSFSFSSVNNESLLPEDYRAEVIGMNILSDCRNHILDIIDEFNLLDDDTKKDIISSNIESIILQYSNDINQSNADIFILENDYNIEFDYEKQLEHQNTIRFIYLINIIYLVNRFISELLRNDFIEEKKEECERYYSELNVLERTVAQTAYSQINPLCYNLWEYRIDATIDPTEIENKELKSENTYLNTALLSTQNWIEEIVIKAKNGNIKDILSLTLDAKKRIEVIPDINLRDKLYNWFNIQSQYLYDIFLDKCSDEKDNIEKYKNTLKRLMGSKINLLSENSLTTLATAEMLFDKYAISENKELDIDYSFISALYYQAIEGAYNTIIWEKYVRFLNSKNIINPLCKPNSQSVRGYLPDKPEYYTHKDKNSYYINTNCMMRSFAIILDCYSSENSEQLKYFRGFLKELFGYSNTIFEEAAFRKKIRIFHRNLSYATGRRNDSSHPKIISRKECIKDRSIAFLNDASTKNPGLIIQLVELFK